VDDLLVLRLLVAVPFAVAGLRKLIDPVGTRRGVTAWGVPARLANATVAALTLGEIVAALGLLLGTTTPAAVPLALGCLALPVVPVAVEMARRGASPTLVSTVVRASVLAIPLTLLAFRAGTDPGPDVVTWLSGLPPGERIAVVVGIGVLAALSSGLRPRQGPPEAPDATGVTAAPLVRPAPELTIGMATYDDFDGVYFTLQALRLYHDLADTELLVVDNYGCEHTREFVRTWVRGTYVRADEVVGTAAPKDLVFRKASGAAVLCCDSHVLFAPGAIARLKRFYRNDPACADLLQGPLVYDDGELVSTHFDQVWRGQMWGTWATDPRGLDRDGEPFEIPMQGLGVFSCRTDAWLGFHPGFRGFGGEEGYIHEKFRQAGRRCLCLPWLRWTHRFGRPHGIPYPVRVEDKLRNYLLGHTELGLDPTPVLEHFSRYLPAQRVAQIADQVIAEAAGGRRPLRSFVGPMTIA
jgi:Methylamine utilisation protein MauE/Glycosyl transferase family 2